MKRAHRDDTTIYCEPVLRRPKFQEMFETLVFDRDGVFNQAQPSSGFKARRTRSGEAG